MTASEASPFGGTTVPAKYQSQILASAARWNIPPSILAAQLNAESNFNPRAVSAAGAEGIAQFLPGTAKDMGVDPWNPASAIDGMAHLDAINLQKFNGSYQEALAAYNAGAGAVEKYDGVPPFAETQNYVKKILTAAGEDVSSPAAVEPVSLTSDITGLKTIIGDLSDVNFWKRFGFGFLGTMLVLGGIYMFLEKEAPGSIAPLREIKDVIK